MKKILFVVVLGALIAGCGRSEESVIEEFKKNDENDLGSCAGSRGNVDWRIVERDKSNADVYLIEAKLVNHKQEIFFVRYRYNLNTKVGEVVYMGDGTPTPLAMGYLGLSAYCMGNMLDTTGSAGNQEGPGSVSGETDEAEKGRATAGISSWFDRVIAKIKKPFAGKNPMTYAYIGNTIEYFESELDVQPKRRSSDDSKLVGRLYEIDSCQYWVVASKPDLNIESISVHPNQGCDVRVDGMGGIDVFYDSVKDTFSTLKKKYDNHFEIYADCIYCGNWSEMQYYAYSGGFSARMGRGISFGFAAEGNDGIQAWREMLLNNNPIDEAIGEWRMDQRNLRLNEDEAAAALKMWSDLKPTSVTIFHGYLDDIGGQHIHPDPL